MTFFYGFLYFVIRDYWSQQDPALREYDAQAMIDLCETRFCAGLEKFETLTVPVMPNIQALLLGVRVINMLQLLHILTRPPGDQSTGRMQVIFELDVLVRRCHHVSYPWLPSQIFPRPRRPRVCGYQATYVLATIHVGQEPVTKSWTRIELSRLRYRCRILYSIVESGSKTLGLDVTRYYLVRKTSGTGIR
jgi:hypothetical protein